MKIAQIFFFQNYYELYISQKCEKIKARNLNKLCSKFKLISEKMSF